MFWWTVTLTQRVHPLWNMNVWINSRTNVPSDGLIEENIRWDLSASTVPTRVLPSCCRRIRHLRSEYLPDLRPRRMDDSGWMKRCSSAHCDTGKINQLASALSHRALPNSHFSAAVHHRALLIAFLKPKTRLQTLHNHPDLSWFNVCVCVCVCVCAATWSTAHLDFFNLSFCRGLIDSRLTDWSSILLPLVA